MLNWIAIGLLAAALVAACLAWAGWVRFRGSSQQSGRAFAILDIGVLLQAVSQTQTSVAVRWTLSGIGAVFVILGAILVLRLRKAPVTG